MRDQFQPTAEETPDVRLAKTRLRLQCAATQIEHFARIHLTGHESLLWETDAGDVGDGIFPRPTALSHINEHARVVFNGFDDEGFAVASGDRFTRAELHAFEYGSTERVQSPFPRRRKFKRHAPGSVIDAHHETEAQLGFSFAHPSLTYDRNSHDPMRAGVRRISKGFSDEIPAPGGSRPPRLLDQPVINA